MYNFNFISEYHTLSTRNCVYKATDMINNRAYIGKTEQQIRCRIVKHHSDYLKSTTKFHRIIRKYGWNNIQWDIIYVMENQGDLSGAEKLELGNKEDEYIKLYAALDKKGMNLRDSQNPYVRRRDVEKSVNSSYKINKDIAQNIIDMLRNGYTHKEISAKLDVSMSIIKDISGRKTWKHLGYHHSQKAKKEIQIDSSENSEREIKKHIGTTITFHPKPSHFTRPYNEETNPMEQYDLLALGDKANEILFVKKQIANGLSCGDMVCSPKIYSEIKYKKKYMCILPELNKLIYK